MVDAPGSAAPTCADPTPILLPSHRPLSPHNPPSAVARRRTFLTGAAGVAGLLVAAAVPGAWAAPSRRFDDPFTLGVASGDPTPTGVVLWTRLAPRPLDPDGGMPGRPVKVQWEVATGPRLRNVVRRGVALAHPRFAHSVHVEVDGLEPGRTYWYRFRIGGHLSRVGRTRTTADPARALGNLTLAFTSCQHWERGYYPAWRHLAEEDLDLVLHLGDYIYEGAGNGGGGRRHVGPEPTTLAGYRIRRALYKTDPDLQAAHGRFPFVVTWDDHEVENDYAGRHPADGDPGVFAGRRAAAYRAFWEHLPIRRPANGPNLPLSRRLSFGDLAELFVLDTRQYRDDQACAATGGGQVVACPERLDRHRSILGGRQRRWLLHGLDRSQAVWNVLAQQVLMAEVDLRLGPGRAWYSDAWDGYAADRARLLRFIDRRQPANPVVLGGDIQSFFVNDLKLDNRREHGPVLATEFVGTSDHLGAGKYGAFARHLSDNPHIRFFESRLRGYTRCTILRQRWYTDLRVVDTIERRDARVRTLARFMVKDGRPGPHRVH
jgi:alkaline phosphatase D